MRCQIIKGNAFDENISKWRIYFGQYYFFGDNKLVVKQYSRAS